LVIALRGGKDGLRQLVTYDLHLDPVERAAPKPSMKEAAACTAIRRAVDRAVQEAAGDLRDWYFR
jgi:hypothetical protein